MKSKLSRIALVLVSVLLASNQAAGAGTMPPLAFEEMLSFSLGISWCENHLSVADFDRDGRNDIVLIATALASSNGPPWSYNCHAILLHSEANGGFSDSIISNFPGRYGYGAFTGDLNNDGFPDLILRESSGTHVLLNDQNGSFGEVWSGTPGYYHLVVVDMNHDGFLDFVSGTQTGQGGLIELFTNDGTGTRFTRTWQSRLYGTGYDSINTVLIASLNGDAITDIAASEMYGGRLISLFGTNSGPPFVEQNVIPLGDRTFALAGGRVNRDSFTDLAACIGWGYVQVWTNQGNGAMRPCWQSPSFGQAGFNLALADFDQDGLDDLFVGTFGDGALRIYGNTGAGFEPAWDARLRGAGYTGTVADLNGDGWPDLIVGEKNFVRVFANRSNAPRLTSLNFSREGATLTWSSRPGRAYRVQFKSNVAEPEWKDLPGDILSESITASQTDPSASPDSPRFYRVLMLP